MKKLLLPIVILTLGIISLGLSFMPRSLQGDLDVNIIKVNSIMPAAHNVYANPNALDGEYYLFKSKITNNTNKVLEDVIVRYRIPGYIDWTELDIIGEMKVGQTASVCCYPKFKEDICEKMTESVEQAEIEISWDGADEDDVIDEEFSFKISDRNEFTYTNIPNEEIAGWADVFSNGPLLACFVTPNDPIVKYYTQNIQEKILMGEQASVTKDPKEAVRLLKGIYNATILSHMVYSGTKGTPTSVTDYSKFSQQNRLPREVITGNTGLCLELSLLYASVLSNAGMEPIIYLVPGHAYPGFKLHNEYYAIEATSIGGEGIGSIKTADEALETGMKELNQFIKAAQNGDPRYSIVDINQVNQKGVTPMALKDDEFLRKKVDVIVASWSSENTINSKEKTPKSKTAKRESRKEKRVVKNHNSLSFSIPSGWQTFMYPMPDIPILTAQALAPDQVTVATVYDVPTANSYDALATINTYFSYYGMTMDYQVNGSQISGITYSTEGNLSWIGKILNTSNGLRIVAVGTPDYLYNQNSGLLNSVFNSIK